MLPLWALLSVVIMVFVVVLGVVVIEVVVDVLVRVICTESVACVWVMPPISRASAPPQM